MLKTARYLIVLGAGLSASAIVGWFLLRENKKGRAPNGTTPKTAELEEAAHIVLPFNPSEENEEEAAPADDDLTQINDIGPRFAEALRRAGITRFAQLAKETPEGLAERLAPMINVRAQRIRNNDWIGQAAQLARNE